MTLGEDAARNLGVDLARVRYLIVAGTALSVGAATAIVGTIGFVGLVVPHVLRPLVGHAPSRLLPASLLGGAALVLAADIVLRLFTPWRRAAARRAHRAARRAVLPVAGAQDALGAGAMMLDARDVTVHLSGRPILRARELPARRPGGSPPSSAPTAPASRRCCAPWPACCRSKADPSLSMGARLRALRAHGACPQHRLPAAGADRALATGRRALSWPSAACRIAPA